MEEAPRNSNRSARRTVRISNRNQSARTRLWAYSYADLAELFGITEHGVRKAVSRGHIDPGNLESVCRYWLGGIRGDDNHNG